MLKDTKQLVPCGRCCECLKRKTSAWSFRLMQEFKGSHMGHFITLTYSPKHAPISENGFMTVCKRDCQLFMKRLRKANKAKLKYFIAAEYGGKTLRPHYHMIIFNCDISTISPSWNLGEVHFGSLTVASTGYTLKYISKGKWSPRHKNDDRTPEFRLMSKGLGKNYLTNAMIQWHHADKNNRLYCVLEDGKKIAMPRYYKQKIYTDLERQAIGLVQLEKMMQKTYKAWSTDPNHYRNKLERQRAEAKRYNIKAFSNDKL